MDVSFLEQNVKGLIFSEGEASEATEDDIYPHRILLLRPELVELYHATMARDWIEQQVQDTPARRSTLSTNTERDAENSSSGLEDRSFEKSESAASEDFVQVIKKQTDGQDEVKEGKEDRKETSERIIDVGNFKLAFNPDAFVDRPNREPHSIALARPDEEEDTTKAVRNASNFVRQAAIPSLLCDVISDELIPLDSAHLSRMLHKKGINIRYLGLIAESTKTMPKMRRERASETADQDILAFLAKFRVGRQFPEYVRY